jgi:hypothetical protein
MNDDQRLFEVLKWLFFISAMQVISVVLLALTLWRQW